jgi:hypothetical protein
MELRRRYPILVAFLAQTLLHHTDVAIELYEQCLWEYHGAARQELAEFRQAIVRSTNNKFMVLYEFSVRFVQSQRWLRRFAPLRLGNITIENWYYGSWGRCSWIPRSTMSRCGPWVLRGYPRRWCGFLRTFLFHAGPR